MLMDELWYILILEYYSALRMKEILPFATTWEDLKGIMLGEISQKEKVKYKMVSLRWNVKKLNS